MNKSAACPKYGDVYFYPRTGAELVVSELSDLKPDLVPNIAKAGRWLVHISYLLKEDRKSIQTYFKFKRSLTPCEARWLGIKNFGTKVSGSN